MERRVGVFARGASGAGVMCGDSGIACDLGARGSVFVAIGGVALCTRWNSPPVTGSGAIGCDMCIAGAVGAPV